MPAQVSEFKFFKVLLTTNRTIQQETGRRFIAVTPVLQVFGWTVVAARKNSQFTAPSITHGRKLGVVTNKTRLQIQQAKNQVPVASSWV